MTPFSSARWIVCQTGAREHYAIPRTLHRARLLAELVTDAWVPPKSALRLLPGRAGERFSGRYDQDLSDARVAHFTMGKLAREMAKSVSGRRPRWDAIIDENNWFQDRVIRYFMRNSALNRDGRPPVVFAYSYAARRILAAARAAGAKTVLGQIDGGEADEELISSIWLRRANHGTSPEPPPKSYWTEWHDECRIADNILVNSDWSRDLLVRAGIDERKMIVTPVIYERGTLGHSRRRLYPTAFNAARPLRVLFLGALTIRKGLMEALEAARALRNQPVVFSFVGADPESHEASMREIANVTFHGAVPRSEVHRHFHEADVFLFPTHSDGFGMTQIEAQEFGLPVIASRNCGAVVENRRTGLILNEIAGKAIASAIGFCLDHPSDLAAMSVAANEASEQYSRRSVASFFAAIQSLDRGQEA